MENQELILRSEALLCEESTLSPEKEQAYISEITKLTEKNSSLEEEVNDLRQQLAYLKKALYGQKSEKTEVIMENAEQLSMFNDAEENTEEKVIEKADKITVVTHERKKHSTHRDSFENLETEEVIHEAEDKVCPECGNEMEVIGKEFVRDELVYHLLCLSEQRPRKSFSVRWGTPERCCRVRDETDAQNSSLLSFCRSASACCCIRQQPFRTTYRSCRRYSPV